MTSRTAVYAADLPIWRELAQEAHGPVLDLGAGTGRVALDLAEAGHDVTALDSDPALLDELARRAGERGLRIECDTRDARALDHGRPFGLAIAPMQFVQILGGPPGACGAAGRGRGLHSDPGGIFAAAISNLDEAVAAEDAAPPLPDVARARRMDLLESPAGRAPRAGRSGGGMAAPEGIARRERSPRSATPRCSTRSTRASSSTRPRQRA